MPPKRLTFPISEILNLGEQHHGGYIEIVTGPYPYLSINIEGVLKSYHVEREDMERLARAVLAAVHKKEKKLLRSKK